MPEKNTMTTLELAQLIGRTGNVRADGFTVNVKVVDARMAYGSAQLCVEPVSGIGTKWVLLDRVRLDQPQQARGWFS